MLPPLVMKVAVPLLRVVLAVLLVRQVPPGAPIQQLQVQQAGKLPEHPARNPAVVVEHLA